MEFETMFKVTHRKAGKGKKKNQKMKNKIIDLTLTHQ